MEPSKGRKMVLMTMLPIVRIIVVLMLTTSTVFAPIRASTLATSSNALRATSNPNGFTLDLIHRDSPNSPLYNPSETQPERLQKSARRFFDRINNYGNQDMPIIDMYRNGGEYIANISIGTPPVTYLAIADTGSSIIWTQCQPCENCYAQPVPIFDPKLSSTYRPVECSSPACAKVSGGTCGSGPQSCFCAYNVTYGDNEKSFTKGLLASDTLRLGSVSVLDTVFGCGTNNVGNFPLSGVSGILGLDNGPASLVSQIASTINGKFSYCFIPVGQETGNRISKIKFGTDAVFTGSGVESTPLVLKPDVISSYFITLLGVAVGSDTIEIKPLTEGNLIVDTGSLYTLLRTDLYNKIVDSFTRQVKLPKVEDPNKIFKLCFATKEEIIDPAFVLYFQGVNGLRVAARNYFTKISEDISCFTVFPNENLSVLGNLAQMNLWVGIDTQAKTFSFVGTDCSLQ